MEPIVSLQEVSTVYEGERRPAIRDVNLTLDEKELVYVVGPNAAGKTTLLETINGLLPAFKGRVLVFGLDLRVRGKDVRREIGYVPQDFMAEPGEPYTALDVVLMGRYGKIGVLHRPERTAAESDDCQSAGQGTQDTLVGRAFQQLGPRLPREDS